ncbi:MAG: hypothetical protein CMF62_01540 [Magnetococcales bacterium]|nr:hypothetical protein [Magnetococcales bacterium]|tara:strand:+ start:40523 stop:41260 length:738 start_codon:yes stop_codon:yes gene_type:complete
MKLIDDKFIKIPLNYNFVDDEKLPEITCDNQVWCGYPIPTLYFYGDKKKPFELYRYYGCLKVDFNKIKMKVANGNNTILKNKLNSLPDNCDTYIIIQQTNNPIVHLGYHSMMFYRTENKVNFKRKFRKNYKVKAGLYPINLEDSIISKGLSINQTRVNSASIHDCAYSPNGCWRSKINPNGIKNFISISELSKPVITLHILLSDDIKIDQDYDNDLKYDKLINKLCLDKCKNRKELGNNLLFLLE